MPRRPRSIFANIPVHIVQRGNDRRDCFRQPRDYRAYLAALKESSSTYRVDIHAYVLMTNHVHLLARAARPEAISFCMQQLGRKYVSYFNKEHDRTGTLWEGRFRSSSIFSERYLFACYRYIEENPVRAGMVQVPREYTWSSYRANAKNRYNSVISPSREWLALGGSPQERAAQYRSLFTDQDLSVNDEIRVAVAKGRSIR